MADVEPFLNKDERAVAAAIDAMEKRRALAVADGDLEVQARVDAWFKQYAPLIREIRDKIEPW